MKREYLIHSLGNILAVERDGSGTITGAFGPLKPEQATEANLAAFDYSAFLADYVNGELWEFAPYAPAS